ncbi:PQQ-dependent catabolism-associated CXXCW motif protein [Paracoccus sp. (in: a-proteobacteria)]|uniref:PQQ-dependent catabolism-associated CXXCW motif protein n=1 Tax=Paracoccus sp. TaxID=267 RepID=UPI0026E05CDF|nr:PQQ-dependent catabolism-associated CXXCW motif protein [Paracoccus sp. (in: a-proteobacteria)]MDO5647544.1 PQQ-dependent catabolism-associated CXXCW motif protein [Paracoccus sp. (in: a-proteobacteria)]
MRAFCACVILSAAATAAGAEGLTFDQAQMLYDAGVPFVDVSPRPNDGAAPHLTIPGALWLEDTGHPGLTDEAHFRLRNGLAAVTQGRPDAAVVLFCTGDCDDGRAAIRHARGWGYATLLTFPDAVSEWHAAGRPLATAPQN